MPINIDINMTCSSVTSIIYSTTTSISLRQFAVLFVLLLHRTCFICSIEMNNLHSTCTILTIKCEHPYTPYTSFHVVEV